MEEFKGTKKPWKEHGHAKGTVVDENGRVVASCMGYSTNTDNGEHIEENYANAKLIAAAPDLLEALKHCVNALKVVPSFGATTPFIELGEKAINKAIGK